MPYLIAGLGVVVLVVGGGLLLAFLTALPVFWLWNWLMPDLFGWPEISIYQALGLSALTSLLFKTSIPSSKEDKSKDKKRFA